MFGAHVPELLIVLVLALAIFGPKRLPEIGGAMGRGIRDFRKGISDMEDVALAGDRRGSDEPGRTPPATSGRAGE